MSSDPQAIDLAALGWDAEWAAAFAALAADGSIPARVARVDRGACNAMAFDGMRRVQLHPRTEWPVTGDWIALRAPDPESPDADTTGFDQIDVVLPRRSGLQRMDADERRAQVVAANIDVVMAVLPLDRPFKAGLRDRLMILAAEAGARPIVIRSKADLADAKTLADAELQGAHPPEQLIVSAIRGDHVDDVQRLIDAGQTAVMLGPSGAGKSTLANALVGEDVQSTGAVREGDSKGRHTTTSRDLLILPSGGVLIDTPGVRAVGLWEAADGIEEYFDDISELAAHCRFNDCAHDSEPGCAVQAAIAEGDLDAERVERWRALVTEASAATHRRKGRR